MRIGWKLAFALVIPLVGLMAALGYVFMERSRELLREELTREGRGITRVVQLASEDYLRDRQVTELRDLADKIEGYERVVGVRLFDEHGTLTYQTSSLDSFPFQNWDNLRRVLNENRGVEYARAAGVAESRLSTMSYGKERPFAEGSDASAWRENRRAHFTAR